MRRHDRHRPGDAHDRDGLRQSKLALNLVGELLGWQVRLDESGDQAEQAWAWAFDPERDAKLGFEQVPEDKAVKNRLHLDLFTSDVWGDRPRASRGSAAGAWSSNDPDDVFVTRADPEGNKSCVHPEG